MSEQNLADQARAIRNNNWLSTVELEEIKRRVDSTADDENNENRMNNDEMNMQQNQEPIFECRSEREDNKEGVYQFRALNPEELSEGLRDILNDIKLVLEEDEAEQPRFLKHVERKKLREVTIFGQQMKCRTR